MKTNQMKSKVLTCPGISARQMAFWQQNRKHTGSQSFDSYSIFSNIFFVFGNECFAAQKLQPKNVAEWFISFYLTYFKQMNHTEIRDHIYMHVIFH